MLLDCISIDMLNNVY